MMKKKSLVKGATVLAAAGIAVKAIGAVFRIPLANLLGSEGMTNYSPAYFIYSFLLVFAIAGLPVAISKMVSERCAVGHFREAERVFKLSRMLMIIIGAAGFCILFFFSDMIAGIIKIPGSALSMKVMAPALLLVPVMASYRGYFQGMQEMIPTAVSQAVEQVFRVSLGLAAAVLLMRSTVFAGDYPPRVRGAAGGCMGAVFGAIGGLAAILVIYMIFRRRIKDRIKKDVSEIEESTGTIIRKIVVIAVPITIGAAIMPLVNLIDGGMVKTRLLASGFSDSASDDLYGQLTAFAEPIIGFPQVIMTSIVLSLVPMIAASNKIRDKEGLHGNISLGLRVAMIVAFPCAIGLFVLAGPVLTLLYSTQKESALHAVPCMQVLALGFVFLALITTMTGVLQGIGRQVYPMLNLFIGVLAKLAATWILTGIPEINIVGAALGTMLAYTVAAFLDYRALKKFTGVKLPVDLIVVKPLISSLIMGAAVFLTYKAFFMLTSSNAISTMLSIIAGVLIYGFTVLKMKAVKRDELVDISIGRVIVAIGDKLKIW